MLVFAKDYIIFLTEIYDIHYVHTLSLWYTLTYVRAAPFLALIPDEVGILLKFYETYIKLWLLNFNVYKLESLGELGKRQFS